MNSQLTWVIIIALGVFLLLVVVFFGTRARPGTPARPPKRRKITADPTEEDCDKACQYLIDNPGLGVNMCDQQACRESSKFAPYCVCAGELAACEASKITVAQEIATATQALTMCQAASARFPTVAACQEAIPVTDMCEVTTGVLPDHFSSFLVVYRSGTAGIVFNTAEVNGDRLGNTQDGNWANVKKNAQQWTFSRVMDGDVEYWHITPIMNWPYAIAVGEPGDNKVYIANIHDRLYRGEPHPDEELWKFSTNSHGQVPQITSKAAGFEGKYLEQDTGNWKMANSETNNPFNFFPGVGQCTGSVLSYKTARGARRAIGDPAEECDGELAACTLELEDLTHARDSVLESLRACEDHIARPITVAMCQSKHPVTDMCVFSQSAASKDFTGSLYTVWNSQSVIKVAGWYAEENKQLMISAQNRSNSGMRPLYFTHLGGNRYWIRLAPTTHYLKGSQQPFFQTDLGGNDLLEWYITGDNWNLTIQNAKTGFYLYKEQESEGNYPIDYGPQVNSVFNGWSLNNVLTDFGCAPSVPRYKT